MLAVPQTAARVAQNNIVRLAKPAANNINLFRRVAAGANNIRPLIRKAPPVLKYGLLGKVGLAITAFEIGWAIGTEIRKRFLDPSQPKKKPQPVFDNWTYVVGGPGIKYRDLPRVKVQFTLRQKVKRTARYWCSNGELIEGPVEKEASNHSPKVLGGTVSALRWKMTTAVQKVLCGSSSQSPGIYTFEMESLASNEEWRALDWRQFPINGSWVGTRYSNYRMEKAEVFNVVEDLKIDDLPKPVPKPPVRPAVEPEPELQPEVAPVPLPATVPTRRPVQVPTRVTPLTEPKPATTPKRKPATAPPVVQPATAPRPQPTQRPTTTRNTTKSGEIVKAPPRAVNTTNRSDHFLSNGGGRIAGRTASTNPTQMAQEIARLEQKTAGTRKGMFGDMDLGDWFEILMGLAELLNAETPGTTYKLQGVCECPPDDDDCEEPTVEKVIPTKWFGDASIERLDAIAELLQPLKTWKQPICNEKPCLEGDFRTISFISDEKSAYGNDRLRKRFRYRSLSGLGLDAVVAHWKDFTFDAGPVCVQHSGHSWGTPQVWAASVNEGKRVIFHAGREAGVDPSQVGKWTVSGSNNPRYGVSGTMRVNTKGGYYWITSRLGADERPLVQEL